MDKDILEQYLEIKGEIRDLKERIDPGSAQAGKNQSRRCCIRHSQRHKKRWNHRTN